MHNLEIYPLWKIRCTQRLIVRFIPDLNKCNPTGLFIDEYHFHTAEINGKRTIALCSERHEDSRQCYHCIAAKRAFSRNIDSRKYWRKQYYTGNVIIIEDPLDIIDPANPKTYKLPIGKQLFNSIKEDLVTRLKSDPTDYYSGNNFIITREIHAGRYPKYTGAFRRRSKLTTEQIELAEESLLDLSELRPTLFSSNFQDDLSKKLCWEILGNE